ncbi:hypothetical protein [Nonomuraea deserti]|nr:hypothetical protein [Nonomuraea deserti]
MRSHSSGEISAYWVAALPKTAPMPVGDMGILRYERSVTGLVK